MESEILALEHSFLKVPHEQVAKTTRHAPALPQRRRPLLGVRTAHIPTDPRCCRAAQQLLDSEMQLVTAQLDQIVSQASSTSPLVVAKVRRVTVWVRARGVDTN